MASLENFKGNGLQIEYFTNNFILNSTAQLFYRNTHVLQNIDQYAPLCVYYYYNFPFFDTILSKVNFFIVCTFMC